MSNRNQFLRMITLLSAALLLAFGASGGAAPLQATNGVAITKMRENGRTVRASLYEAETSTNGFVTVVQDQIANTLSLSFGYANISPDDPNFVILITARGVEIPNTALTIDATSAHLAVTTPPGVVHRCVAPLGSAFGTCSPTGPVTFDLTWTSDGFSTARERVKGIETLGPLTTKYDAEYTTLTAIVNGTFGPYTGRDMLGYLYDTEGKTFYREDALAGY